MKDYVYFMVIRRMNLRVGGIWYPAMSGTVLKTMHFDCIPEPDVFNLRVLSNAEVIVATRGCLDAVAEV
jgi:hypothetical protein